MNRAIQIGCLVAGVVIALAAPAHGQTLVEARVASVAGQVLLSSPGLPAFALTRGYVLNPGVRIDTRGGGRLVIDFSDGSTVVVQPDTVLLIKDYRSASSLRELFEITLGRVQVKINHWGGRPNPYRMNSPTASIAVRGTEFSVSVDPASSTQVMVYEGAVEVTDLNDPRRKVLIEAGRGVLVQAGQDFSLLIAQRDRDFNDHADGSREQRSANGPQAAPAANGQSRTDHDESSPRATVGTYERYITSLSEAGRLPFLMRYNAFAEAYLDSLENPAYATVFSAGPEGRFFLMPTTSGIRGMQENVGFGPVGSSPANYSISPQLTLFAPLPQSNMVVGGSLTASRVGSGVQSSSPDYDPGVLGQSGNANNLHASGSSVSSFYSGSIMAASRFGDGRTSLGTTIESLHGNGSLSSTTADSDTTSELQSEQIRFKSSVQQTRLTAGFSREMGDGHKLGIFYRYAFIEAKDADTSHTLGGMPAPGLDSSNSAGHSSEIGFRLRGPITRNLFYGVNGGWLGLSLKDGLARVNAMPSEQQDRAERAALGLGLGYAFRRRTIFSIDLSAGQSQARAARTETATGGLLQTGNSNTRFVALHWALQSDINRHLFVSASLLGVCQAHRQGLQVLPDSLGQIVPVSTAFFPVTPTAYQKDGFYSDYGVGWRFSRDVFAQYVYSTDYGFSASSHTLMLRYTFHLKRQ